MFDRFTDRARKTMDRSWREARRLGHDYIGTEHVLFGLLDDDGVAGNILKELRVDLARLRAETMQYLTPGPAPIAERQIPFTPRAKRALELALEEANSLGHNHIGPEHLLLGLIREEEGIAAKALAGTGLRAEDIRKHMPPGSPTEKPVAPATPARPGSLRFDRFTDRARKVMGLALREALRFNHDHIGTEHMMLGVILEGSGVGADVLKNLDVDAKRIRLETERLMTPGTAMITTGRLPFTPAAKRVLELTREAAIGLGHDYLGTEHLLLGLIREEAGIAARVLAALGVTYENARREVVELLGGPPG